MGVAKEVARTVLPMGTFTQLYWTVNARALMNFLSLRTDSNAQLDIRKYANAVETFWADMYKRMPITEVGDVGMTFAESEVRHKDAYARLLRILGLEKEFETVIEIPAISNRIKYLKKYLDGSRSKDDKMYTKSVLLFSLFIEHVSLFSQFLIMMSFIKERNH